LFIKLAVKKIRSSLNNVELRRIASLEINLLREGSVAHFWRQMQGLGLTLVHGPYPLGLRDLGTLVRGVQRQEQTY